MTERPADDDGLNSAARPLLGPRRLPSAASLLSRHSGSSKGLAADYDLDELDDDRDDDLDDDDDDEGVTSEQHGLSGEGGERGEGQHGAARGGHRNDGRGPSVAANSAYAEVRAAVSTIDDTSLSINTPRMWVLATIFTVFGSATNLFFSLRYPTIALSPVIALLLVHPLGLLWDLVFKRKSDPESVFKGGFLWEHATDVRDREVDDDDEAVSELTGLDFGSRRARTRSSPMTSRLGRLRLWLGQGRWNVKEHACVYVASNVSFGFAFATDIITEQTHFYGQAWATEPLYQLPLTLASQLLGYAFAGLTQSFLVRPGAMIWPATLVSASMFATLHRSANPVADGWRISRYGFFVLVFAGAFCWYFVPGLVMPALSYFSVLTWLAPDSVPVATLFGVRTGLGLLPLTFDWAQIAYVGSPIVTPWWAAANVVGGLVVVMWIVAPVMYYCNAFFSAHLPILSSSVFDNRGKVYEVPRILDADSRFDPAAFRRYSPVFLPITFALSYALQFASLTALVTHTACWHGKDLWRQWRSSRAECLDHSAEPDAAASSSSSGNHTPARSSKKSRSAIGKDRVGSQMDRDNAGGPDIHFLLMRKYPKVPASWYLVLLAINLAIGVWVVESYRTHLPSWGLLLALLLCLVLYVPTGIVMATTNQQTSTYLVCQILAGHLFPGRPVANMIFVLGGYICLFQGLKFSADLKLGQYMKVPPRLLFAVQTLATTLACLVQLAVLNWMFANVDGICTEQAVDGFSCPMARVHFNGSILWGAVGPASFFGAGALYRPLVWAFPLGAVLPVLLYLLHRYGGVRFALVRKVSLPVVFGSLSWIPPATGLNFSVWALVCFGVNHVLRRRRPAWWAKYSLTLSAGLDAGLACALVVIFFGVLWPGWADGFSWWGTEVYKAGCDWKGCPLIELREGETFGPDHW